ncbi:MAG: phosphoribosylamine--glycine ligase [Peptoniphilaceae bacterium]|nr:phosphoribosylamine--glycine ligase [Peptoniphilaceae bacterium]
MKILVIGGGGREHAIIQGLKKSAKKPILYAWPGNGGIARDAICVGTNATDIQGMVQFARNEKIDYVVVTPDDPLVLGAVDAFEAEGIPCFGPNARAAILEGSKIFAKELMKKYRIPTAAYAFFDEAEEALAYMETAPVPAVIKADGLALGKGVVIAQTRAEARNAICSMMKEHVFGASGDRILIEEFLEGPEVSVLAFTDGKTLVPMISSMDHKRARDGDTGLNTGGMGAVAPNPYYTASVAKQCMEEIFIPTMKAMREEGRPFRGCLYFGLMLTEKGPKVIEYNCRFGDPETQVVLPLLENDLLSVFQAVTEERLSELVIRFRDEAACCVVLASDGYPKSYEKGFPISWNPREGISYFVAGAAFKDGHLVTSGGRVLGVTALGKTMNSAIHKAYQAIRDVHFANKYYRSDIGRRALQAQKEER